MSSWSTWGTHFSSDRSGSCLSGRRCEGDDGMVSVFVALTFTVILMFTALVIDGGVGYQSHRQSQNAADAGAMAGARALDQVRFLPSCPVPQTIPPVSPCTTYTSTADVRAQVLNQAKATGADTNGISCWLVRDDFSVGVEICNSVTLPDTGALSNYTGVKVSARITKSTNFAKSAGFTNTTATSTATAFLWNFGGGTGSPFIICGSQKYNTYSNPDDFGYDILNTTGTEPDGPFTYTVKPGKIGSYYSLQSSQVPDCGNTNSRFKGQAGSIPVGAIPTWTLGDGGNSASAAIEVDVAGIKPCPPILNGDTVDGCGMVLPIADKWKPANDPNDPNPSTDPLYHVVTWLAFQVWGSGNSFNFNALSIPPDTQGTSCKNPFTRPSAPIGQMKYCGKLLGPVTITGGLVAGPATAGSIHVIRLIQ